MKHVLFALFCMLIPVTLFAQGNNNQNNTNGQTNANIHWKVNGNTGDTLKYIGTNNNAPLIFKTRGEEQMRIDSTGNVGIGVKNPTETIDVFGNIRLRKDIKIDTLKEGNPGDKVMVVDGSGLVKAVERSGFVEAIYQYDPCDQFTDGSTSAYPAPVWNNAPGTDAGILYTGDNCPAWVGIGTDEPERELDVNGTAQVREKMTVGGNYIPNGYVLAVDGKIICEEVKVQLRAEWGDYVFADGYYLIPIDSLETFIKMNQRLPGIPPADEVESNGLSIGEMQTMMMKKIEELTLYLIEMNARLEALEKENEALKKKLK